MGWFSSCEHEWRFDWQESTKKRNSWTYDAKHKCEKCGKIESCDFSEESYRSTHKCSKCHCHTDWCIDD